MCVIRFLLLTFSICTSSGVIMTIGLKPENWWKRRMKPSGWQ